MNIELGLLFGAIGTFVGIIGAVTAMRRNSKSEGEVNARMETQLSFIARGVDDIRIDQRSQASKIESQNERIIRVEESAKQAHKRIDGFVKSKGGGNHNDSR